MSSVINLGFISIHIYSICILIGMICGYFLFTREAKRHGIKEEDASNLIFYAIVFGIIGARVWYCLFNLDYYLSNPISIFKVWEGGLAIHGGILFGFLSILVYCKRKNLSLLPILDYIVVGLIIAQAIGRWGNFFNGEAHGQAVSLSYLKSMHVPDFIIQGMYIDGKYYIPTFLYESLWCLLGFIIMFLIRNKRFMKIGYLTGFYFIWYGIERFYVEGLRTDSLMFLSFRVAQIVSVIMFVIGISIFVFSLKKGDNYLDYGRFDDD